MDLLKTIYQTLRIKISPVLAKVKLWLTPAYVKNKALVKLRIMLNKLLDVKPKDENDYYPIAFWLVSKKLATAVIMIICIVCVAYITSVMPESVGKDSPYKTYKYNSPALKFQNGTVCILGKSGYKAYVGDVAEGVVKGNGTLYNPEGVIVYEGEFDADAYNGEGRRYYDSGVLWYDGEFTDNVFNGKGKLYRENATLKYDGEFQNGYMQGSGVLYDDAQNQVYHGMFGQDRIRYTELLGKTTQEVSQAYTGRYTVYQQENDYCTVMKDIDAVYYGTSGNDTLSGEWVVTGIYVLDNEIYINGKLLTSITEIENVLGEPIYEGNTNATMYDAVAIKAAGDLYGSDKILHGYVSMDTSAEFEDLINITAYDKSYLMYIYVFKNDDIVYTFYCTDKDKGFGFYLIEQS